MKTTPGSLNIPKIIQEYGSKLHGFIRKRVKEEEDAADILQEVFYQLAEAERLFKPIDQLAAWLYTVARNKITDSYRKKKTVALPECNDPSEDLLWELNAVIDTSDNSPENQYLRNLFWEELELALAELPAEQREVFELTELEGLSYKAIAKLSSTSVNTLISRKHYAVLALREWFKEFYDEFIN